MTKAHYLTFQKFNDQNQAQELGALLSNNNIDYEIEDNSDVVTTLVNNEINHDYRVKIDKAQFEKANELLLQVSMSELDHVDKDYYLYSFTDVELIEILTKSDEWGPFDYLLAQRILKERGQEVNPAFLESLKKYRLEELAKPEDSGIAWIIVGYILALAGGFISIFLGWHLFNHRKTLSNGDSVFCYSENNRKHGLFIFLLGIAFFILWGGLTIISFLKMM